MSEINAMILDMIKKGIKPNIICERLNISLKELKRRIESIKYDGYNIRNKFYYDGTKKFILDDDFKKIGVSNSVDIDGVDNSQELKFMVISDTHIGHRKANMGYIYKIYEYANNNNINMFIHAGDLLDGNRQSDLSLDDQIVTLIDDYPKERNSLTFISFGNHEEDFATQKFIDLGRVISREREDLIPLGYGNSFINILDNQISISHEGKFPIGKALKIAGHSHRFKFITDLNYPIIVCPTLSDYLHVRDYPGAIELHIAVDNGKFSHLIIKHLVISEAGYVREVSTIDTPFQKRIIL